MQSGSESTRVCNPPRVGWGPLISVIFSVRGVVGNFCKWGDVGCCVCNMYIQKLSFYDNHRRNNAKKLV